MLWPPDTTGEFTVQERRLFTTASRMKPSEWAATNRYLTAAETAEPGRWKNERTPYLVGIMDAAADPAIQKIVVMKSTQIGFSECIRNVLGYYIDQDPGPCLLVMPDEKSAKEAIDERIKPLIDHSPVLQTHLTDRAWDVKLSSIKLDTMPIYTGWSGSPQTLATRPCRYVFLDEVDKYARYSGREADPISLALERTRTFGGRKKVFAGSSPTTSEGTIYQLFIACADRRTYRVPCPKCGSYQQLSFDAIKWPKGLEGDAKTRAQTVRADNLAWYECKKCHVKLTDHDKMSMLSRGLWASEGVELDVRGVPDRPSPVSTDVGFHINALYSPWVKWSEVAANFLASKDYAPTLQNFRNSWLGEPFEIQVGRQTGEAMLTKTLPENVGLMDVVPDWASVIYATADVQSDHFWYVIRAWGWGNRSQLIRHGMCFTFDELYRVCMESAFPIAGRNGQSMRCPALIIDSGARTSEVYDFAFRMAPRVIPVKGGSTGRSGQTWYSTALKERPGMKPVELRVLNVEYYKDLLACLISDPDQKRWQLHGNIPEDYLRQMSSEHRVLDRRTNAPHWEKISSGVANHLWDCEVYQCAVAEWGGVGFVPPPAGSPGGPQPQAPVVKTAPPRRDGDDFNVHAEVARRSRSNWLDG